MELFGSKPRIIVHIALCFSWEISDFQNQFQLSDFNLVAKMVRRFLEISKSHYSEAKYNRKIKPFPTVTAKFSEKTAYVHENENKRGD